MNDKELKIELYEPAMCCSSGVCGPSVDPELLRMRAIINHVNKEGVLIERFNLKDHPMAFVQNSLVQQIIAQQGMDVLPLVLVSNRIAHSGSYPSNALVAELLGLDSEDLEKTISIPVKESKPKVKLADLKVRPRGEAERFLP